MKRIDLKTILRMDFMIQHRCTGSPAEFARKLELSRSTLFEYLAYMRNELDMSVPYDRYQGTYYYDNSGLYASLLRSTGG